ncbi:MAG: polyprenyl synthetase family protein [Candidatus Bathyarchaeota archaeon]|nr:polyprenyl synthetase family protein [Candidatus Bathyarchaeota archaeon]
METTDKLLHEARNLLKKEGEEGWRLAKDTILTQKTKNTELEKAMRHIMLVAQPDHFRPALLSFCSRAVGGESDVTVPFAASLVLFARAIGIHDDIMDRSKTKNNQTTTFGKFGKDLALILADILLMKGFTLIRKTLQLNLPTERVVQALDIIDTVWFVQSEGGILDIQDRGQTDTSPKKCLFKIKMIAAETEAIARIGSILGGGAEEVTESLGKYGRLLSTSYIIRNELIDMLDFKALKHRIKYESLPLPLLYALQDPVVKPKALRLVSERNLTVETLQRILLVTDSAGGMDCTANIITQTVNKAKSCIRMLEEKSVYTALVKLAETAFIRPTEWKHILDKT